MELIDNTGQRFVLKAKRPVGHQPGCACRVCGVVDKQQSEADSIQQLVTGEDMSKSTEALAKSLENIARHGTTVDPILRAQAGMAATQNNLRRLNEARGLAKTAGFDGGPQQAVLRREGANAVQSMPGQPSGLTGETTHERESRELAEAIASSQQAAQRPINEPPSALGQMQSVVDGTNRPVQPAAPLTTPELDYRATAQKALGDFHRVDKSLLKRLHDAGSTGEAQLAGEELTLHRLRMLNELRGFPGSGGPR